MTTPLSAVLAQNNFGDTASGGMAGPTALFIIVLLAIATVLLIRSMNRHLRNLPERFPVAGAAPISPAPGDPASPTERAIPADEDAERPTAR